jgi:hypothetical protein
MGTVVRLYLGWRLLRFLRPLLGAAALAGVLLALHGRHLHVNGSAARALRGDAAASSRDLPRALERGFATPHP